MYRTSKSYTIFQFAFLVSIINVLPFGGCDETKSTPSSPLANVPVEQKTNSRLPTNVKPTLYDISLTPDLENATFEGKLIISLKISQSTDTITLNSVNLTIKSVQLTLLPSGSVIPSTFQLSPKDQTLNVNSSTLTQGDAQLSIHFTGTLANDYTGCYRGVQTNAQGKVERYYLLTQFETIFARTCFPCFDEPAMKAQFDLTLFIHSDYMAISSMPVIDESKPDHGIKTVKFARTPIMSTYLLAFAVGHFSFIETVTAEKVPLRMYTLPGKEQSARFALEVTSNAVKYFSEYFDVPLPLPKLDSIVTPDPDNYGMENFGLITYTEKAALEETPNPTPETEITIASITCHEVCHQWLGNLVSAEWWTYDWLTEGCVYFLEILCEDTFFPQYEPWTPFITDRFQKTLTDDAFLASKPIEVAFDESADIDQLFLDQFKNAFLKGASLLKMVHDFVGAEAFKNGFRLYVKHHEYSTVVSTDIWAAIEEASSRPIKQIMTAWTKVAGFPLLIVESSTQETGDIRTLVISQIRFLADPNEKDDETSWVVPMAFSKQSKPTEICLWTILDSRRAKISIDNVKQNEWVKLNPGITPFYRTKYTDDMYKQLLPAIKEKVIPLTDRITILDDAFALARNGRVRTPLVVDFIKNMREEEDRIAWFNISRYLGTIHNLLLEFTPLDSFYSFGRTLMESIVKKIGYDIQPNEKYAVTQTRTDVLWSLFLFEEENFAKIAVKKFQDHVNGVSVIPESFRGAVYRTALAVNGESAYDSLLKLYRQYTVAEEKNRILRSFEGVKDINLADKMLQFSLSSEVDSSGVTNILKFVSSSKVGRGKTWQFVKKNYDVLSKLYGDSATFWSVIGEVIQKFTTEESLKDVQAFLSEKKIDQTAPTIQSALTLLRINIAWLQKDGDALKSYFSG